MVQPLHQGSGEVSLRPASCWKFVSDQVEHVCRKSRSIYLSALAVMQLATKARPSPRCQLCQGSGAKKVAGNDLSCGHDASKSGYCVHGTVVPCVKTHSPVIVRSSYGTCGTPASHKWHTPVHGVREDSFLGALWNDRHKWPIFNRKGQSPLQYKVAAQNRWLSGPVIPVVAKVEKSSESRSTRPK